MNRQEGRVKKKKSTLRRKKKYNFGAHKESHHHVIPESRTEKATKDIAFIPASRCRGCFHLLFKNLEPHEVIMTLIDVFFGKNTGFVYEGLQLLGESPPSELPPTVSEKKIVIITNKQHKLYNMLFTNLTPQEVIAYVVVIFFKKDTDPVYRALKMWRRSRRYD